MGMVDKDPTDIICRSRCSGLPLLPQFRNRIDGSRRRRDGQEVQVLRINELGDL